MTTPTPDTITRHVIDPDAIGIPYARAGTTTTDTGTWATATCPVCGHVALGYDAIVAVRAYGLHYERAAARDAIATAVDHALTIGALSEPWAASIYANLSEPDRDDTEGWSRA